jgi:hypothetical protein
MSLAMAPSPRATPGTASTRARSVLPDGETCAYDTGVVPSNGSWLKLVCAKAAGAAAPTTAVSTRRRATEPVLGARLCTLNLKIIELPCRVARSDASARNLGRRI